MWLEICNNEEVVFHMLFDILQAFNVPLTKQVFVVAVSPMVVVLRIGMRDEDDQQWTTQATELSSDWVCRSTVTDGT